MYVSETGRSLQSRMSEYQAGITKDGQSLLYKHFHLPGHSVADKRIQILEKIYYFSESPVITRLHWRLGELHRIKELGIAVPYDCNDQIKGVGTLGSPSCRSTNFLGILTNSSSERGAMEIGITTKELLS